jgi:uncharacterized membrane protein
LPVLIRAGLLPAGRVDCCLRRQFHGVKTSISKVKTSAIGLVILAGLLGIGGFFRFDHLARQSLWVDEFWALYLATGRGNLIFDLPLGRVIESPPAVGFAGAPHWWHIWTGLASTPHPPLYHLALRGWVDLFGDGDFAVRAMSAVFGLGCIYLIFDVGRKTLGDFPALIAAGVMAVAATQIEYSQEVRPYAMLVFVGLILCKSLILIEQKGLSRLRILSLGFSAFCLALTHYFSLGAIIAVGLYALIRFDGRKRLAVILTIAISMLLFAAVWGPIAWTTRHSYIAGPNFGVSGESLISTIIDPPRGLVIGNAPSKVISYGLAFLVYLLPLLTMRRRPQLFFWWLWAICTIGFVVAVDVMRGSQFAGISRYVILASPGIYLLLSASLDRGVGKLVPLAVLFAAAVFGIARWQTGTAYVACTSDLGRLVREKVGARDAVIITGHFDSDPAFRYFITAHYAGDWKNPVVLLTKPADSKLDGQLAGFQNIWVIGYDGADMRLLPGWRMGEFHSIDLGYCLWKINRAPK